MADFSEILTAVGDFGPFQKLLLVGLCLPNTILPFHLGSLIFVQSDPERHCNTDWILRTDPNLTADEQLNLTLPRETDGGFSKCLMFVPVDWDIDTIREYGLNDTTACQNGWVYDSTMYKATIVTDFDLICGKEDTVGVAQAVFMGGVLVGSLLFGPFAESFGRKRAVQIPMVLMFLFTAATGLAPNFYVYLVFMFVVGVSYGGYRSNCVVLVTEWVGVSRRAYGSCLCQLCGGVGQCILAGLVYFIRNWRLAQFIMAAPAGVILCYIWIIPESARWLLGRGRTEEAKQEILRAAAMNKRTLPDSLLEKIAVKKTVHKGGIKILIKSPLLIKYFLLVAFAWFSLNLSYFSLSFSVGKLGLDIFLAQLMFGLADTPAHLLCIWLLETWGRQKSLVSTLLVGGLACILMLVIPQDSAVAITTLAASGRFFLNWAGSICNVYIQELFPTSVRQTASGLGNIVIRLAGLLAPLLNLLAAVYWAMPTIVFSSLSLASGVCCILLPETRQTELPDSADEVVGNKLQTFSTKKEPFGDSTSDHCGYGKATKL